MERRKVVHQLDTPFSDAPWPHVSQEDQDVILELLCSILSPLGQYRTSFIPSSKGKRDRRRKRKNDSDNSAASTVAPPPELGLHLDVGLSKISKTLEGLSTPNLISTNSSTTCDDQKSEVREESTDARPTPYAVVFIARSKQCSAFHSHFPQMVATASQSLPPGQAIRLVGFSKACEERLSSCLGIPRVSSIALRQGSHGAESLVDFVRAHVAPVRVPWLQEDRKVEFLGTKINACQTTIGPKRQKRS